MTVIDQIYQEDKAPRPAGHPRILALANQKGGVGKTTTAINLGTALAAIGERVLIVDLDPQGNASTGLGIDRRNRNCSTYDVLIGEAPLRRVGGADRGTRLHIAPSTMDLSALSSSSVHTRPRVPAARCDRRAEQQRRPGIRFTYVLIDCPPSLNLLDRQCDGRFRRDPGAVAVRVLRARRACRSCCRRWSRCARRSIPTCRSTASC